MAGINTFHCSVVTPERLVLDCDATFAAFPAHDGEIGILVNRAPLVCKLGIGTMRVESPGTKCALFIDGGFAQVVENKLTILTEQAKLAENIDRAAAESALLEAGALRITDEASYAARDRALRRAHAQLKLAKTP